MKLCKRMIFIIGLSLLTVGFRVMVRGNSWAISPSDRKIWIVTCPMSLTFATNNLPAGDPLAGSTPPTFAQILMSVVTDYNSVSGSFLVLSDASTDPAYNTTVAAQRTINMCTGAINDSFAAAFAVPKQQAGVMVGCDITIGPKATDNLKGFVSSLTHEIGHCFGLGHSQETTHAIMSYFHPTEMVRLQTDDKMGLIYLYPMSRTDAAETMTYGMSCSPR